MSLIGWWKFNGDLSDSSGNGYNGTSKGSPGPQLTEDRNGNKSSAVTVGEGGSYVDLGHPEGLDPTAAKGFAISAWFRLPEWPVFSESTVVRKTNVYQLGFIAGGKLRCLLGTTGGVSGWTASNDISYTFTKNTWYHLCGSWDGSKWRIYVNGELVGEFKVTGTLVSNTVDIGLGAGGGTVAPLPKGSAIDDIRIFDSNLSEAEVKALFTATDAGGGGEAKSGSASVTGGGSATASGQKLALGVVSASGGGSVAETGQKVGQGTASASGGGSAALSGSKLAQGVALVTGGGSSSASGVAEEEAEGAEGSAAVSGGGSATASGAKRAGGAGSVSGGGGAAATANKTARATVFVAGGGQVAGTGAGGRAGSATVTGGGLVVSAGAAIRLGEVVISGGGTVSALGKRAQSGVLGHPYGDPALRGEATGALRREATGEVLGASRGALRGPVRSIP